MIWQWLKRLFKRKEPEERILLPVYHSEKYDTLYNKTGACKKHQWFFFYHELDFRGTCFHDIGLSKSSERICEKCFLWESKFIEEGAEWRFQGFGKTAFDKLTEKKLESITC